MLNEHHHHHPHEIRIDDGGATAPSDPNASAATVTDATATAPTLLHYRKLPVHTNNSKQAADFHLRLARPPSIARTSSYDPSLGGQSHRSGTSSHPDHHHAAAASTAHEKSKHTRRYFATVSAISWAIFLVIFGTVVFILDAVLAAGAVYPVGEIFVLFMVAVSFAYFIFLYVDIRVHVYRAKCTMRERQRRQQLFEEQLAQQQHSMAESGGGDISAAVLNGGFPVPDAIVEQQLHLAPLPALSHKYCFMTGRHGEFFYLKFGASWFALGLLIHSSLQIAYQVIFLTTRDMEFCASKITLAMDILFPLYSLFVLFFFYKYMNVIINEYRGLARIMIMHALGTSLTMWIYTIVTETANAIEIALYIEEDVDVEHKCRRPDVLNFIHRHISPYLYPFIIEFCILIVGIFYMMWANISHCPRKYSALGHHGGHGGGDEEARGAGDEFKGHVGEGRPQSVASDEHCDATTAQHEQLEFRSNMVMVADCHASNRGMFAGLLLMVATIVFVILFFIATGDRNSGYLYTGILVNNIFALTVLVIMIVAVVLAYVQTAKLDINHHPMSMLDDMLLFIAVPAFFLETVFSLVPAVLNESWLNMALILAQLLQILIQTPFIIDGLRRCSNAPALRKQKPGRELITFLTIANVSLWLWLTFSVKTNYTGDERYEFYGYVLWNILNHISLPLIMFYRFHSSVCLVDMWRHSYEPEPADH